MLYRMADRDFLDHIVLGESGAFTRRLTGVVMAGWDGEVAIVTLGLHAAAGGGTRLALLALALAEAVAGEAGDSLGPGVRCLAPG